MMIVLCTGCRSGFGLLIAATAARAGHTVYAGLRDLKTQADLVTELLTEPAPRLRYALGPGVAARIWSRRFLSFEVVERILKWILGF